MRKKSLNKIRIALRECIRLLPALREEELLKDEADYDALVDYCAAYGGWVREEDKLRKEGNVLEDSDGSLIRNPRRDIANKYQKEWQEAGEKLGLTPKSREKRKKVNLGTLTVKLARDIDKYKKRMK